MNKSQALIPKNFSSRAKLANDEKETSRSRKSAKGSQRDEKVQTSGSDKSLLDQVAFEMDVIFARRWEHPNKAQSCKELSVSVTEIKIT